jgi:hypothetical protein
MEIEDDEEDEEEGEVDLRDLRVKEERRILKFKLRRNRADNNKVKDPGRRRQKY